MVLFNANRKPDKLKYRPIGECYLIYKGKLVAQDHGHYLSLPGGGIDKGETPINGAKRELVEELGSKLKGPLKIVSEMTWDWNPSWANNEKRKQRYMQFRGERVYSMIGEVESFGKPISDEGDAWKGKKLMSFANASKLMNKFMKKHTPENQYAYNLAKLNIISTMHILSNKK